MEITSQCAAKYFLCTLKINFNDIDFISHLGGNFNCILVQNVVEIHFLPGTRPKLRKDLTLSPDKVDP